MLAGPCNDQVEVFDAATDSHDLRGEATLAAKAVCAVCPVRSRCLEWALAIDEPEGILGGLSPHERRRLGARAAA